MTLIKCRRFADVIAWMLVDAVYQFNHNQLPFSESHTWCAQKFGPNCWSRKVHDEFAYLYDREARWGFVGTDFFFRYPEDAILFKLRWLA